MPKVSVIVPVYGVEQYIEHCAESLMRQTIDDVEYIFINDASKDRSEERLLHVIQQHPNRKSQISILSHAENKGLPAARNTGLDAATGEYIFHCDSDDFLEPDMLEQLYTQATQEDADIVWCDWYLSFNHNERYMVQPQAISPRHAVSLMLNGVMKYNVWNKLTKRTLYTNNHIRFPEGNQMGEDMTMIQLTACASKVGYVNKALYHYIRVNSSAMTQQYSTEKLRSLAYNTNRTLEFLETRLSDALFCYEKEFFKLNVKLPFLFTGNFADIKLWNEWYPESNKFIFANKSQSLRTRLLQWCAAHKLSFVNRLYFTLIFKFLYGVVYK